MTIPNTMSNAEVAAAVQGHIGGNTAFVTALTAALDSGAITLGETAVADSITLAEAKKIRRHYRRNAVTNSRVFNNRVVGFVFNNRAVRFFTSSRKRKVATALAVVLLLVGFLQPSWFSTPVSNSYTAVTGWFQSDNEQNGSETWTADAKQLDQIQQMLDSEGAVVKAKELNWRAQKSRWDSIEAARQQVAQQQNPAAAGTQEPNAGGNTLQPREQSTEPVEVTPTWEGLTPAEVQLAQHIHRLRQNHDAMKKQLVVVGEGIGEAEKGIKKARTAYTETTKRTVAQGKGLVIAETIADSLSDGAIASAKVAKEAGPAFDAAFAGFTNK